MTTSHHPHILLNHLKLLTVTFVQYLLLISAVILLTQNSVFAQAFAPGEVFAATGCGKVKRFTPAGTLVSTLDGGTNSGETTGMAFDTAGNLISTHFTANTVVKFNNTGGLIGAFGSGYNAHPESTVIDAAGNIYIGQADGTGDVLKFSPTGTLLDTFDVPREARGSDHIDLAADQKTLFYTSEDSNVLRYDLSTHTALPIFNVAPLPRPLFALRVLADGGVLVAGFAAIYRLNSSGVLVQTYDVPSEDTWFAANLDPDGTTFWSGNIFTGKIYRFNLTTGAVVSSFDSTPCSTLAGLAVFGELRAATASDNNITISDQKAGSMLVFPYYTAANQSNTRIQITNVGVPPVKVHILLMDKSCQQLDYYTCITPNGSVIEKASNLDPDNAGYIIVLAVNDTGQPIIANRLIGNAFVNDGEYVGNYGAEAFWGGAEYVPSEVANNAKTDTANLTLKAPCEFAVEIQSPKDAVQRVIVAGLRGNVNTMSVDGTAQVGTGFVYNAQEQGGSFQKLLTGSCFSDVVITNTFPRVPTTLGTLINMGNAGHLRFSIGAGVGLLLTAQNSLSKYYGIRTLHKIKTTQVTLTVPVFMPTC